MLPAGETMSPAAHARWVQMVEQYLSRLTAAQRTSYASQAVAALNADPLGPAALRSAEARYNGLGDIPVGLITGLATLATTAVTVGVGLYDKEQQRKDQKKADAKEFAQRQQELAALQQAAVAQTAQAQAGASKATSFAVRAAEIGVGGAVLVVGLVVMLRMRGRKRRR